MIVVLDYGIGNVRAIVNMFRKAGYEAVASASAADIGDARGLVLPGVGGFDAGMELLNASGTRDSLENSRDSGVPILGICLGMQLLGVGSDEGTSSGLGWLPFISRRLQPGHDLRVPHMGWNQVEPTSKSVLFPDPRDQERFYFLHSFAAECATQTIVLAESEYGVRFASAVGQGNVNGVQFHPEKSHRFGMRLLARFGASTQC